MKKLIILSISLFIFSQNIMGQTPSFKVEINLDTVLLGNHFEVKFVLENADGNSFEPPNFKDFDVLSGPNTSSMVSIVNGSVSKTASYTYILKPNDIGNYFIEPAYITTEESVLETNPVEIIVAPNPDGVVQEPKQKEKKSNDSWFNWPDIFSSPKEKKPEKKKRKTYRI